MQRAGRPQLPWCLGPSVASPEARLKAGASGAPVRPSLFCPQTSALLRRHGDESRHRAGPRNSTPSGALAWVGGNWDSVLTCGGKGAGLQPETSQVFQRDSVIGGAEGWKRGPTRVRATPCLLAPGLQGLSRGLAPENTCVQFPPKGVTAQDSNPT